MLTHDTLLEEVLRRDIFREQIRIIVIIWETVFLYVLVICEYVFFQHLDIDECLNKSCNFRKAFCFKYITDFHQNWCTRVSNQSPTFIFVSSLWYEIAKMQHCNILKTNRISLFPPHPFENTTRKVIIIKQQNVWFMRPLHETTQNWNGSLDR